jgi:hypothetical protein
MVLPKLMFLAGAVLLFTTSIFLGSLTQKAAPAFGTPASSSAQDDLRFWMQMIISLLSTVAALIVILRRSYGPKDKHWAYGTLGMVFGFWLKQ